MRRGSNLLRRHALTMAVIVIFCSCGAVSALAQGAASADEAARAELVTLCGGALASELDAYPHTNPVIVAYNFDHWVALIVAKNAADCPSLLAKLVVAHIPGCVGDGAIMCCDPAKETMVLSVTYEDQPGWLRLGELCEEPPDDKPGVEVVTVPQSLTRKLAEHFCIFDEYMDYADDQGRARMLWNWPPITPPQECELSPPMIQGSGSSDISLISLVVTAGARSPIVLAHHSPGACVEDVPNECDNNTAARRCHPDQRHWFRLVERDGEEVWCRRTGCRCE